MHVDHQVPAVAEAELPGVHIISDVQQRRPPPILTQINRRRSGDQTPQRTVGNVVEKGEREQNSSGERNCDAEVPLGEQDRNVDFLPGKKVFKKLTKNFHEAYSSIFRKLNSRLVQLSENAQSHQQSRQHEERVDSHESGQEKHRREVPQPVDDRMRVDRRHHPKRYHVSVADDDPDHRQASNAVQENHFLGRRRFGHENRHRVETAGERAEYSALLHLFHIANDFISRAQNQQKQKSCEQSSESEKKTL